MRNLKISLYVAVLFAVSTFSFQLYKKTQNPTRIETVQIVNIHPIKHLFY